MSSSVDELRSIADPVWFNTYWVQNALGLYEGVSAHAEALNKGYGHFFGLIQKISSEYAVLVICKMFDKSNPQYQKDTVYVLLDYLKSNFTPAYTSRLKPETLTQMGILEEEAEALIVDLRVSFDATKNHFLNTIVSSMPNRSDNEALEKLFLYRDKVLAHQERLGGNLGESLKSLPSLASMEIINQWAEYFVILVMSLLTPNVVLLPHSVSARRAALNVTAKLLDRNFEIGSKEYDQFFKRLPD